LSALAAGFLLLSPRALAAPDPALAGKKVLLLVGEPDEDHPSDDAAVQAHLQALGLTVTLGKDEDPASRAAGQDLVVISGTVNPYVVPHAYKHAAVPVLTWSAPTYPTLGLTGRLRHKDFDIIEPTQHFAQSFTDLYGYCVDPLHPIAREAGLPSQMFGTLYLQPSVTCWGRPGPAAQVIAIFEGDPNKAGLFTYEKGASLSDGAVAPARRVGFFLGTGNFHLLTAVHGPAARDPAAQAWYVGLKLFDASVHWALTPPPAPPPAAPAALHAALAQAAAGKKVLFVERIDSPEGKEADEHNVAYLRGLGFTVTVVDQDAPQGAEAGQDLVVLSATCSKYKLNGKYGKITQPIMCHEGLAADGLKMAGWKRYVDYGEHGEEKESEDPEESYLDIVGAWHPLAAGFKAGPIAFIKEPGTLKWATPTRGAIVIATLPYAPEQCAIFGYERGSVMVDDYVAPARRLLFPLDNPAFDDLTENGLVLYDAAVLWCIGAPGS